MEIDWGKVVDKLVMLTNKGAREYWPFLLTFIVAALVIYAWQRLRPRRTEAKSLVWVETRGWNGPFWRLFRQTSYVDIGLATINVLIFTFVLAIGIPCTAAAIIKAVGLAPAAVYRGGSVSDIIGGWLAADIGWSDVFINVGWALGAAFAYDFTRSVTHYAFHRVPFLWEFHKIHHDPDSMTPITAERFSFFELAVSYTLVGFITVAYYLGFVAVFGANRVSMLTIGGINVVLVATHLWVNFRHSSIWISFGKLDRVIMSPSSHLIHHSREPRHRDKNFANVFSLCDIIMGTLYVPKQVEHFPIGVSKSNGETYINRSVFYGAFGVYADAARVMLGRKPSYERGGDAPPVGEIAKCWCSVDCRKVEEHVDCRKVDEEQVDKMTPVIARAS
jgi:sterol desaturase/sphingolipid hydroxylase (fatty acid hydroxylase superfamily)